MDHDKIPPNYTTITRNKSIELLNVVIADLLRVTGDDGEGLVMAGAWRQLVEENTKEKPDTCPSPTLSPDSASIHKVPKTS
jgi:hypothetical protein